MAKSTNKTAQKYSALITKTDTEIQAETLDLNVGQAQNNLEQGILSVQSLMITAQSDLKKAQNAVVDAQRSLDSSKAANPFSVQNVLNARTALQQSKLNVETKQEAYDELKATHEYLVELKAELF